MSRLRAPEKISACLPKFGRAWSLLIAFAMALGTVLPAAGSATLAGLPAIAQQRATAQATHPTTGTLIECVDGKAKIYDCKNVDLLAHLPPAAIGNRATALLSKDVHAAALSDMWGWTDPASQREFAIICLTDGTAFVEATDPLNPTYLGKLPVHPGARPNAWRDVKVYQHHAFVVADIAGAYGMQIFDLTQLLTVKDAPVTFTETAHYTHIGSMHNIIIDTASGFAYTVGGGMLDQFDPSSRSAESCGGGLHMIDIRTPASPTFAGCFSGGYIHDAQCVTYRGPDRSYRGREICINAGGGRAFTIVDVAEKKQPKVIGAASYPTAQAPHQGWLTDDHRYFFLGDEGDEENGKLATRTIIFDLNDLGDPVVAREFFGTTNAIDHNMYVRGRYLYQANYKAGLRVLDIGDPTNPKEVGYFDTTPDAENDAAYGGAWSNYPFFKNGTVGISSISEGFFLVRFKPSR